MYIVVDFNIPYHFFDDPGRSVRKFYLLSSTSNHDPLPRFPLRQFNFEITLINATRRLMGLVVLVS